MPAAVIYLHDSLFLPFYCDGCRVWLGRKVSVGAFIALFRAKLMTPVLSFCPLISKTRDLIRDKKRSRSVVGGEGQAQFTP